MRRPMKSGITQRLIASRRVVFIAFFGALQLLPATDQRTLVALVSRNECDC